MNLQSLSLEELEALLAAIRAEIPVREQAALSSDAIDEVACGDALTVSEPAAAPGPVAGMAPVPEADVAPSAPISGRITLSRPGRPARVIAEPAPLPDQTPAPVPSVVPATAPSAVQALPTGARYRHPTHRDLSWDGEGSTPEWVGVWLASGRSLDALAVAAEKLAPRILPPSFLLPPAPPPADPPPTGAPASEQGRRRRRQRDRDRDREPG